MNMKLWSAVGIDSKLEENTASLSLSLSLSLSISISLSLQFYYENSGSTFLLNALKSKLEHIAFRRSRFSLSDMLLTLHNKDRKHTYKVIRRRVHKTIVVAEK